MTRVLSAIACVLLSAPIAHAQTAALTVGGDDPIAEIRDQVGNDSDTAATLRLLERAGIGNEAGGYLSYNGNANRMDIGTVTGGSPTPVMSVRRAGARVGIGTVDPATRLHVVGDGNVATDIFVQDTGFTRLRLEASGSLSPDVNLTVQSRNSTAQQRAEIGTTTNHDVVLFANGDIRIRLDSSGAVCIGNC